MKLVGVKAMCSVIDAQIWIHIGPPWTDIRCGAVFESHEGLGLLDTAPYRDRKSVV